MKKLLMVLVGVLAISASAFAGNGRCGGYMGGGSYGIGGAYSGCGSYGYVYNGRGSYYGSVYSRASCAPVYRTRVCSPSVVYYNGYGCDQVIYDQPATVTQKVDKPNPPALPESSPLPPEPKPAVQEETEEITPLPLPPKEEFDTSFNIRIKHPNGRLITAKVKHGFVPEIKIKDGKAWAVYGSKIPFAKYQKMYERDGYIAYVSAKQQSVLVAAR